LDFLSTPDTRLKPGANENQSAECNSLLKRPNFGVEFYLTRAEYTPVKVKMVKATKSDGELLDQATSSLLKAVKQKMLKKQGRVDYSKLRKDGYSDRFLAKLEGA
jgi:hypothetical protein